MGCGPGADADTKPARDDTAEEDSAREDSGKQDSAADTDLDDDADNDGFAAGADCDDTDAAVNPEADEVCDGVDDDCDGLVDDACRSAPSGESSLDDAEAVLLGTEEGTWTAYATSAGQGAGEGSATFAIAVVDPYGADCSRDRVFLYDSPPSGHLDVGTGAAGVVLGEATGCIGFPVDVSDSGDGDGVVDLLVDNYEVGGAYVFRGPLTGERSLASAELVIEDGLDSTWYSAWLGDVDGVPGAEVGIGDPNTRLGTDNEYPIGEMEIYSAASDGTLTPDDASAHLTGTDADWYFGEWFASVGDMNGDGVGDIAVDGHWFFYGPLAGELTTADADITLYSNGYADQYTLFAARGGDVDGDGLDDAAVAAWWGDGGAFDELGAVVVTDADRGTAWVADLPIRLTVPFSDDDCSNCGLATGDLDGDGHEDILLGGAGPNGSGVEEPAIWLEYGPFAGVREIGGGAVFTVPPTMDYAGSTWALSAADLNGDGFDDLLAGGNPAGRDGLGAAYIVLGGPELGAQ
jgi:hypothetical protein